jgi:hypothetical protein
LKSTLYIIENLSLASLLKVYFTIKSKNYEKAKICLYYINSTRFINITNKLLRKFYNIYLIKYNFEFEYIFDQEQRVYGLKKVHEDSAQIIDNICKKEFHVGKQSSSQINFAIYFKKKLVAAWPSSGNGTSLNKILLMLYAVANHAHNTSISNEIIFIIDKRPWIKELQQFASKLGIELVGVKPILGISKPNLRVLLLSWRFLRLVVYKILNVSNLFFSSTHNYRLKKIRQNISSIDYIPKDPMIIVDQMMQYFGPSTFWKTSHLPFKNIIFVSNYYKVSQIELDEIRNNGMEFIALSKSVANGTDAFYFSPNYEIRLGKYKSLNSSWGFKIMQLEKNKFFLEKSYWTNLFKKSNAKIYATHLKWDTPPIVATEAINELGGVSALWQTSFYETMGLHSAVNSDIYFSFSSNISKIEKLNGSSIKYIVGVGYIFDFNFRSAKLNAEKIKEYLNNNNALKIISIFDGGSSEDERWSVSNASFKKDYQFILEKVLENSWLGLIIKSKKPGSLRHRLGNVSEILDSAIKTGRCYFSGSSDYGDKNLSVRPADAAYASDIAIHLCLYAGSAGLEAALTGTPTLLLDRYNLKDSQFYKLDKNKVVFHGISEMWDAIKEHWERELIPGFGDWSPIMNDIDPFRDGKAAQRVNSFILTLLDGFKAGYIREEILENAVEIYGKQWGYDKIALV